MKDYSQYGESIVLKNIFDTIGTINNYGVEFGAWDGFHLSNLRMFLEMGWDGLQIDGLKGENKEIKKEFITKDNINLIFDKYNVPKKFDLLSIDIDGNDYWVWKELEYYPNVVIIEYNCHFDMKTSCALEYDENSVWDGSYAFGASLSAFINLADKKGYYLYKEHGYVNLIFIKKEFQEKLPSIFNEKSIILPQSFFKKNTNKKFIEV